MLDQSNSTYCSENELQINFKPTWLIKKLVTFLIQATERTLQVQRPQVTKRVLLDQIEHVFEVRRILRRTQWPIAAQDLIELIREEKGDLPWQRMSTEVLLKQIAAKRKQIEKAKRNLLESFEQRQRLSRETAMKANQISQQKATLTNQIHTIQQKRAFQNLLKSWKQENSKNLAQLKKLNAQIKDIREQVNCFLEKKRVLREQKLRFNLDINESRQTGRQMGLRENQQAQEYGFEVDGQKQILIEQLKHVQSEKNAQNLKSQLKKKQSKPRNKNRAKTVVKVPSKGFE